MRESAYAQDQARKLLEGRVQVPGVKSWTPAWNPTDGVLLEVFWRPWSYDFGGFFVGVAHAGRAVLLEEASVELLRAVAKVREHLEAWTTREAGGPPTADEVIRYFDEAGARQ